MLSLTLLRSWFPVIAFIWLIYLFYKIFYYQTNISKKILQFLTVIFLYVFFLFSYNYHFSKNNKGVVTSNSAINLLIGNNPYSQGTYTRHWVTFTRDYNIDVTKNDFMKKVIEINLENPMLIASNTSKKLLLWFFSAGGPRPISPYYQHPLLIPQYFYRITVFLFLLFGIRTLYKYKKGSIIIFLYFIIFSIHMVYFADYRFTLTAMPFQAIIVSFGFLKLLKLSFRNSDAHRQQSVATLKKVK
jgi:hypothetical protein